MPSAWKGAQVLADSLLLKRGKRVASGLVLVSSSANNVNQANHDCETKEGVLVDKWNCINSIIQSCVAVGLAVCDYHGIGVANKRDTTVLEGILSNIPGNIKTSDVKIFGDTVSVN